MTLPLPDPGARWALFLDFDGTLVDIAPAPDLVHVPGGLPALLERLRDRLDGALGIVSGRPIGQIDAYLRPFRAATAGLHGLERRRADGTLVETPPHPALERLRARLVPFVASRPGLLLEDKGLSIALHYRNAPERGDECRAEMEAALADAPGLDLLHGKMVFEARPHGMDKGSAIALFLTEPPFHGRTPVFAGDDRTDEDGFRIVAARGGLTVKVGAGDTLAAIRAGGVAEIHEWLTRLADHLDASAKPETSP
jgi:trehalose 6-phosphate phosphatase